VLHDFERASLNLMQAARLQRTITRLRSHSWIWSAWLKPRI